MNVCLNSKENFMAMQVKIPPHTEIIQREISRVFLGTTFAYFLCGAVFDSTDKSLLHTHTTSVGVSMKFAFKSHAQLARKRGDFPL